MTDHTFRIRIQIAPNETINIDTSNLDLSDLAEAQIEISSGHPETPIRESKQLILRGSGYGSEDAAIEAGEYFRDIITIALAKLHIGADFGDRAPRSGFTSYGLSRVQDSTSQRSLNNVHGLMVFETDPSPVFVSMGEAKVIRGSNQERFLNAFSLAFRSGIKLSGRERLAYDIFSASYFARSQDARLIMLTMAIEILSTQSPRPIQVREHIDELIALTQFSDQVSHNERKSLVGALKMLMNESIGRAGRRFIEEALGKRKYQEMPAKKFFRYCYVLRSKLVHGADPFPDRSEISYAASNLETMVANLIAISILDDEI